MVFCGHSHFFLLKERTDCTLKLMSCEEERGAVRDATASGLTNVADPRSSNCRSARETSASGDSG